MKFIFFIVPVLIGIVHFGVKHIEQSNNARIFSTIPIYVVNTSTEPVGLFDANNSKGKPVMYLGQGDAFLFQFAGQSGGWLHGIKDNQMLLIKSKKREKAVKILDVYMTYSKVRWGLFGFILICVLYRLGRLMVLGVRKSGLGNASKNKSVQEDQFVQRCNENSRLRSRTDFLEAENERLKGSLITQTRLRENASAQVESSKAYNNQQKKEKEYLIRSFQQKEKELVDNIRRESETRTHVHIEHMQASYNRLHKSFNDLKLDYARLEKEGLVLGVDFNGSNYENVLKGRKFEIFFAKQILTCPDFEILEWTSDKGVEQNIKVRANGNPDFVINHRQLGNFAVECKYRGGYLNTKYIKKNEKKKEQLISWSSSYQSKRYKDFSTFKSMPVFVALGFMGEPTKPTHNFLIDLDYLLDKSDDCWVTSKSKDSEQSLVWHDDIFNEYLKHSSFVLDVIDKIQTCCKRTVT